MSIRQQLATFLVVVCALAGCGETTTWVETDRTWTWDGTAFQLEHPQNHPKAREGAAATYDALHRYVLLFGGRRCQQGSIFPIGPCTDLMDTWSWDGKNWHSYSPQHRPDTSYGQMVYDAGLQLPVFLTPTGVGWKWEQDDWKPAWSSIDSEAEAIPYSSPRLLGFHRAMGYDEGRHLLTVLSTTHVTELSSPQIKASLSFVTSGWDGSTWRRLAIAKGDNTDLADDPGGPDYEFGPLAYDRDRGRLVAMGSHRLWMWDGRAWVGQPVGSGLVSVQEPASDGGRLVYDPVGHRLLWFESSLDGKHYHGTRLIYAWARDGWTKLATLDAPMDDFPTIAFDEARGRVLLFGGQTDS